MSKPTTAELTETLRNEQALLKHIRGMDESTCKWCGITRSGWCKRAEAAEADAVLNRGMEVTERKRAEKAEAQLAALKPYIEHPERCEQYGVPATEFVENCTCGLEAILENNRD